MSQGKPHRKNPSLQARNAALADLENFDNDILSPDMSRNGESGGINKQVLKMNNRSIATNPPPKKSAVQPPVIYPDTIACLKEGFEHRPLCDIQNPPLERFGLQVRMRRKKARIDPVNFAVKIDLDLETLVAIEYGFASFEIVCLHLNRIANGLNIPSSVLKSFLSDLYKIPPTS